LRRRLVLHQWARSAPRRQSVRRTLCLRSQSTQSAQADHRQRMRFQL